MDNAKAIALAVRDKNVHAWHENAGKDPAPILYLNTVVQLTGEGDHHFLRAIFKDAKLTEDQMILIRRQDPSLPRDIFDNVRPQFAAANKAFREDKDTVAEWVPIVFS
jgi:hypothetical protein